MRLSKRLSDAVHFAHWCEREGQKPLAVAQLVALAQRAYRAGVDSSNRPGKEDRHSRRMEAFEVAAQVLGYSVDWPGLWPVLSRNGSDVYLPDL